MSKFDEWFKAQHGPRSQMPRVTDQDLQNSIEAGNMARAEVRRRDLWDHARQSAMYAWSIKDADKK
jgi:hypothetical protein